MLRTTQYCISLQVLFLTVLKLTHRDILTKPPLPPQTTLLKALHTFLFAG